eukprot:4757781-Amphidinium_carterae.3
MVAGCVPARAVCSFAAWQNGGATEGSCFLCSACLREECLSLTLVPQIGLLHCALYNGECSSVMAQNLLLVLSLVKDSLPWLVASRQTCPDCDCHCSLSCGAHTCSGSVDTAQAYSFSLLSFLAGCVAALVGGAVWARIRRVVPRSSVTSQSVTDRVPTESSSESVVRAVTPSLRRR